MEVKNMEKTNKNSSMNKLLDGVAWGSFFILLGIGWLLSSYYAVEMGAYIAIGVGAILIAINVVRPTLGINISKFSLFIGLIAIALGGSSILNYSLPLIPTLIMLAGLFVVAEGLQKLTTQKQQHVQP
jgi:hypothetical protein